jgi:hypothetical protein
MQMYSFPMQVPYNTLQSTVNIRNIQVLYITFIVLQIIPADNSIGSVMYGQFQCSNYLVT